MPHALHKIRNLAVKVAGLGFGCVLAMSTGSPVGPAWAQTAMSAIDLKAEVVSSCAVAGPILTDGQIDFGQLHFGDQSDLSNSVTTQGGGQDGVITVTCSQGQAYTILMDGGNNANAGRRNMVLDGTSVAYDLYTDSAHSNLWNDSTGKQAIGSGAPDDHVVFAKTYPTTALVAPGRYSDRVGITVKW
ncbi:Csu type fimbrial protein [Limibacillus halophilus]|uniref:Spore coat protein U-like protein n=1 Tax=Limibacillus halophilus TaxID=1579333 RepID=A0A839SZN8_9PROT|nr:spore coat U domain-containing protein [Limibacillus halophilus]MBB3066505.1 spore coat protein U-like protein [Limibacillus halophilus]